MFKQCIVNINVCNFAKDGDIKLKFFYFHCTSSIVFIMMVNGHVIFIKKDDIKYNFSVSSRTWMLGTGTYRS
jgi:hypothetical protein